jgi:MFS superfamily sulfate permease-like transporter
LGIDRRRNASAAILSRRFYALPVAWAVASRQLQPFHVNAHIRELNYMSTSPLLDRAPSVRHYALSHPRAALATTLVKDALASIVVLLVALPLCMGIALAVGAPPAAGLTSGIIGGVVVGLLGGSPLQVSGPAAGLIVLVADILSRYGGGEGTFSFERGAAALGAATLLAGAMQLAAGSLRLGQWFRAVSPAVIEGMLAGIGVLIVATQIHLMVDDPAKRAHGLDYLLSIPQAVEKGLFPLDNSRHHQAARVGIITIAVILAWNQIRWKPVRFLPAALVAIVAASAFAWLGGYQVSYVQFEGGLLEYLKFLDPGLVRQVFDFSLLLTALAIAFVASAETLLCATAVDQMHRGKRTRYDRELAAQGLGNMLCGLFAALPITGVIVRSATNVQAGAQTRASAFLHGVWLLAVTTAFPRLLEFVPKAGLAAVLVYTGFRLINPRVIRNLWTFGKAEVLIYLATLTTIVVEDLLTGVAVGVVLSAARILYLITHVQIKLRRDGLGHYEMAIRGNATFLRLPTLAATLERIEPRSRVVINLNWLGFIDHACWNLLQTWVRQHETNGGTVALDRHKLEQKLHNGAATTVARHKSA